MRCRDVAVSAPSWAEGAANWLLDGSWAPAVREPEIGAGGVVARLHQTLKALDANAKVTAVNPALEVFDALGTAPTDAGMEAVPAAWSSGLIEGSAHAVLSWEGLIASVTGRFATRTLGDIPALRLVIRGVRAELLPLDGDDPTYERELERALSAPVAFRHLRDGLARDGQRLGQAIGAGFDGLTEGSTALQTRVRVFERMDGLEEVTRGMPLGVRRHLEVVGDWFVRRRPGVEVLRRRSDGGVELWRGEGEHHVE